MSAAKLSSGGVFGWMSRRLAPAVGAVLLLASAGIACGGSKDGEGLERTIDIHLSRFSPGEISAKAGEPVRIVLNNQDPIEHEWIVGSEEIHELHRSGTHAVHDEIPTEVTIPAFTEKVTTVTFDEPGEYVFVCHLPGHEEYGMRGVVKVS